MTPTAERVDTGVEAAAAASRPEPLLVVENLSVVYARSARAVEDLSFRVGRGEIVALVGPNGAGKTTTLRAVTGFLPGDRAKVAGGAVRFRGQSITQQRLHRIARNGVALIAEREKIFTTLTVEDNLKLGAAANARPSDAPRLRQLVDGLFPILAARQRQVAGYLSGGERQMLAIATALLSGPELLMVDELSLGLAPKVVGELARVLKVLNRQEGLALLLVEQSASVAFALADYVHVMNIGRSVLEGRPAELRGQPALYERYLGLGRRETT